jgi:hypothetical protein
VIDSCSHIAIEKYLRRYNFSYYINKHRFVYLKIDKMRLRHIGGAYWLARALTRARFNDYNKKHLRRYHFSCYINKQSIIYQKIVVKKMRRVGGVVGALNDYDSLIQRATIKQHLRSIIFYHTPTNTCLVTGKST